MKLTAVLLILMCIHSEISTVNWNLREVQRSTAKQCCSSVLMGISIILLSGSGKLRTTCSRSLFSCGTSWSRTKLCLKQTRHPMTIISSTDFQNSVTAGKCVKFAIKYITLPTTRCLRYIIYYVRQKTVPFYLCNSFVRTLSIMTIFGTHILH